jgi:hypothetical protein
MPKEDWVKAETFGMFVSAVFFNKLLQIPFMILNKYFDISYKKLFEIFLLEEELPPIFKDIKNILTKKSIDIQNGDFMCFLCKGWLNIAWPADEFIFIKVCKEYGLDNFYEQAFTILSYIIADIELLKDVLNFNKNLIKMPFIKNDRLIETKYNFLEAYNNILIEKPMELKKGFYVHSIKSSEEIWDSWEKWMKEMVWHHYRSGDYLYKISN